MANVIEIVIRATDQATAQVKGVEAAFGDMQSKVANLAARLASPAGLMGAFGAVALGAAALGNKLSDEVEELQNLSERTGATVNQLRILRQVMVEAGQSPEALTTALTLLNRNLADGNKELVKLVGSTKDPMEALLRLSEVVAKGGNAASVAFAAMGRGGAELSPILKDLSSRFEDVHGRLGDLDKATIDAAGSWDKLMDRMGTSTKRFLDGVGAAFLKFIDAPWASARNAATQFGPMTEDSARRLFGWNGKSAFDTTGGGGPPVAPMPGMGWGNLTDALISPGNIQRRGTGRAPHEQWNEVFKAMQNGLPVVKQLQEGVGAIRRDLELLGDAALSFGYAAVDAFDQAAFGGKAAADAIRDAFMSALRDIANEIVKLGIGKGLAALGLAVGGPVGGALGWAGGKLLGSGSVRSRTGDIYNINALDARSLVEQLRAPASQWNRAVNRAAIGTSY